MKVCPQKDHLGLLLVASCVTLLCNKPWGQLNFILCNQVCFASLSVRVIYVYWFDELIVSE